MINEISVEFIFESFEPSVFHSVDVRKPYVFKANLKIYSDNISLNTTDILDVPVERQFLDWLNDRSNDKIRKSIKIIKILGNNDVNEINFFDANLIRYRYSGTWNLFIFDFDAVTIVNEVEDERNFATCKLNNIGFKLVSNFYSLLSYEEDDRFKVGKLPYDRIQTKSYTIEPFFEYDYHSSKNEVDIKITKVPYLKLDFSESISYVKAKETIDVFVHGCTFFMHSTLDYNILNIQLNKRKYSTYKVIQDSKLSNVIGFMTFGYKIKPKDFLQKPWILDAMKNAELLKIIVPMFIQSMAVRQRTRFLIRYNIMEICKGGINYEKESFTFNKSTEQAFKSSLDSIKQTLPIDERKDFEVRWKDLKKLIVFKPMKSEMEKFLLNKGFPLEDFPIEFSKITEIRNKLVHGSKNSYSDKYLEKINYLMYRLSGTLILDLIGFKDWEFNTILDFEE